MRGFLKSLPYVSSKALPLPVPGGGRRSLLRSRVPSKCLHSSHHPAKPGRARRSRGPPAAKEPASADPEAYMRDKIAGVYRILKYSTWDSAQEQLRRLPMRWDSYTVNRVLKTHPPMEKAWLFFNWAAKLRGFKHDQYTYTTMLDIFGEAGRVSSMEHVFEQMVGKGIKVDAVTYTSRMHWHSSAGDVDKAIEIWGEMKEKGRCPTVVSYTAHMKILFDNDRVKEATDVYREMVECGCSPTCHTYTVLMEYLVGCGKFGEALEIFNNMQEAGVSPDKAMCNILIEKCCRAGEITMIMRILLFMKENCLVLRRPVFQEAMEFLNSAGESDELLRQVNRHFLDECVIKEETAESLVDASDVHVSSENGILLLLLKKQSLIAVDILLALMEDKNMHLDAAITSTIIEENCRRCRVDGALLAFEYSKKLGIGIEKGAYLSLVGCLIRSNELGRMALVDAIEEMIRAGHSPGSYLASLLIYRLGRARRPMYAVKIFNLLPQDLKTVTSYTALVGVYFCAGAAGKALKVYKSMRKKGIRPTSGTYDLLLAGLRKSGRDSEVELFKKERKSWSSDSCAEGSVSTEEKICDLLFACDAIS
ncbi:hypothetical protein ACJRO7_012299 [Eucalyptus globulus]|uniref:Pentatricopeptide repeat-containing protein n=1 Tax=Eucalyptus globulus TaxID=34317 RepID=A0ABD3LNN6_EUCGL